MTEPEEPINPYEATIESSDEIARPPTKIDYPGGLLGVAVVGLIGGLIAGWAFASQASETLVFAIFAMWFAAFAALGAVLPGSAGRRAFRGFLSLLLAIPASILYVPVCGVVFAATDTAGGVNETAGWVLGSVAAFTSVLFLGAVIVRLTARASDRIVPNAVPKPKSVGHSEGGENG